MEEIYTRIWELAKPYYEVSRPMDVPHIQWMMPITKEICEKEGLDDSLLLPLVILHDTGYSKVEGEDYFHGDMRRAHMAAGAKIAREILEKVDYPQDKLEKIVYYVSVHDNWAFDDNEIYKKDKAFGTFNDLDFIWTVAPIGFEEIMKCLNKTPAELIEWAETNDKLTKRPWSCQSTKELFEGYIKGLKEKYLE